jgi:hypothetical protein
MVFNMLLKVLQKIGFRGYKRQHFDPRMRLSLEDIKKKYPFCKPDVKRFEKDGFIGGSK